VWARSKPGQGTTLILRLRRLDAERRDAERQVERPFAAENFVASASPAPPPLATAVAEGRLRG
jgi:hypothetical protein